MGSSRTRVWTRVPCTGRRILFFFFKYLFIYLWLCWVFVSVLGLSLVVASGGHSSSQCAGLSLLWPLLLRSTGSRRAGSVIVAHWPSCSAARGIFPDQGSNPCPLHWQADSQPLRHQGSPGRWILNHCATREAPVLSFYIFCQIPIASVYRQSILVFCWHPSSKLQPESFPNDKTACIKIATCSNIMFILEILENIV